MSAVRIFIVADDALARAGLEALLRGLRDLEVVGGGPPPEARAFVPDRDDPAPEGAGPDVFVWDMGPGGPARERWEWPDAARRPVVALVAGQAQAAQALAAGARGVLPRDADVDVVAAAASAADAGLLVIDPTLAPVPAGRDLEVPAEDLTPREHDVLQLLAEGLANREIARRLTISEHTVKVHVDAILGKLGAHSRTEAVTRAARLGLIVL
jgi:two-component system nitrate/nitrite response regulator NarL